MELKPGDVIRLFTGNGRGSYYDYRVFEVLFSVIDDRGRPKTLKYAELEGEIEEATGLEVVREEQKGAA